jgi:hypothetical protein
MWGTSKEQVSEGSQLRNKSPQVGLHFHREYTNSTIYDLQKIEQLHWGS